MHIASLGGKLLRYLHEHLQLVLFYVRPSSRRAQAPSIVEGLLPFRNITADQRLLVGTPESQSYLVLGFLGSRRSVSWFLDSQLPSCLDGKRRLACQLFSKNPAAAPLPHRSWATFLVEAISHSLQILWLLQKEKADIHIQSGDKVIPRIALSSQPD